MTRSSWVKFKPPIILLLLFLLATLLHVFTELRNLFSAQNWIAGISLFAIGTGMMIGAQSLFRKAGTTIIPAEKPTSFIIEGPYKFTRNPMYVAGALITLGISFMVGTLPFFMAWIAMFVVLNSIHIPYEENHLEQIFGEEYRTYKKRVRRWF